MSGDSGELERNLGFLEAMTLGGGTMIGAGIFILPGIAAEGAGPASSISFGIAGFTALLAAITLAELATGMPIAGGSYHYVNRGLGSFFGSIVGWGMWTGLMFASAFYMVGFGQYIVEPLPFFDGRALVVLFGLLGLALIVAINVYGTEESGGAQNIMIGTEFAIVLVYMILGLFFIDMANLSDFAPTGTTGIVATTGTVFVTFLGFEIIATVAGEIKKPGKLIPLTMVLSVVSVTILYMVLMLVTTGVVPYQDIGDSLVPVSDVAVVFMGSIGVVAIVFAAVIAAISSSNSSILAASRVIFAMGRDNLMSNWFNYTHSNFNTPHRAILVTGAVTGFLISLGLEVEAIVALLAEVASFSFLVSYALVHVALVGFRYADPPEYDPDFAIPGVLYPAVPIAGVVMTALVISQMEPVVLLVGSGVVVLGGVWYLAYARQRDIEAGVFPTALRKPSEQPYRVVVPVANPETERGLLKLAAATARAHAGERATELVAINVIEADQSGLQNVDSGRLDHQRKLLETAQEIADDLGGTLQTQAVVKDDVGDGIVDVVEDLEADQLVLGWEGSLDRNEYVFGRTLDPVIRGASCDVSLVKIKSDSIGTPVALAGPGPHSPVAARRAADFAAVSDTTPVLLNVQPPADEDDVNPVERGHSAVRWIAQRAGLDPDEYETKVVVAEDTEATIIDAVESYDTVCVGLSEKSDISRIFFGSIAERIARQNTGNVSIVRGPIDSSTESVDNATAESSLTSSHG
ncbi:transport protein (probable substrate cationic amino acids) (plasmid) [Natronomonas pharaonis DSM 2160]|uniref:Transport protein (Probable substrate cationic amino acids) n=1 Tax=Natronomonas pharaonis (strain ATCC 35678 / DSM 2160 / CIP 103997 / JCM 8858 / NBRC 14720 / NCIMB 2260 / Gabara) TaxID=348780 RepID=Q3ILW0_NATPD|nr:amino acid permease [Natronomonas pharaonis]CAI50910.1 transport protein (probable substrate cationic amino acids) [Natronomonas pharaonis DSM 2160]